MQPFKLRYILLLKATLQLMARKYDRPPLGQHFLTDEQVIDEMIAFINPKPEIPMVEIGPGRGALTQRLCNRVVNFHVIEIDQNLVQALVREFDSTVFTVHHADALKFDYSAIHREKESIRVVGNLPYSISAPLILRFVSIRKWIQDLCFMVQKEVADRLTAACGTKKYGRLTVSVKQAMTVDKILDVAPESFTPPPKVQSSIVYMKPKSGESMDESLHTAFANLVRMAFGSRRKVVRNSLATLVGEDIFEQAGIDSGKRAEDLTVEQYEQLAKLISAN